jgi:hypothetical protein
MGEMRKAYQVLARKPEGDRPSWKILALMRG